MSPFAIVCTTCSSRLRVRDSRLIGQIVTCPSCGAMVEIRPPADQPVGQRGGERQEQPAADAMDAGPGRVVVGREGQVDSQAITRDAISRTDLPDLSTAPGHAGPVFAPSDALGGDAAGGDADAAASDASLSSDGRIASPSPAGWQSNRTERARQIGLIATLAVAGIVGAAVTFGFFVRRWQHRQAEQRQLAAQQHAPELPTAEVAEAEAAEAEAEAADQAAKVSDAPDAPASGPDASLQRPETGETVDGGALPAAAASPTDDHASLGGETEPAAETDPATKSADLADGAERRDASLLDAVASAVVDAPADAKAAAPAAAAPPELPAGLRQFTPLIDFGSVLPQDGTGGSLQPPPTVDQVQLEAPAEELFEGAAVEPAEPVDAARWLKMRLALQGQGRPLVHWVRVLTQVTGVPIELDLASVDAAGIDSALAIDAPQGWTTAGEAIAHIAAGAGLSVTVQPTHVVLEVPEAAILQGVQLALRVDDLAGEEEAHVLLERLRQISGVKAITGAAAVREPLQVDGDRQSVWRVALAAEALRAARGIPLRLERHRTERWLTIGEATEWPLVDQGSGAAAGDQPQSVLQWLGRMGEANDRQVIVAWGDAWQRGLTPATAAMPWIRPVSAGELIADVLEPYGLQARQAGGGLWWIGSQASYDRGEVFGVVPVPAGKPAEVLETLAQALQLRQQEGQPKPDGLPAVYEADRDQLIVRLPRYLVRQLPKLFGGDDQQAATAFVP